MIYFILGARSVCLFGWVRFVCAVEVLLGPAGPLVAAGMLSQGPGTARPQQLLGSGQEHEQHLHTKVWDAGVCRGVLDPARSWQEAGAGSELCPAVQMPPIFPSTRLALDPAALPWGKISASEIQDTGALRGSPPAAGPTQSSPMAPWGGPGQLPAALPDPRARPGPGTASGSGSEG